MKTEKSEPLWVAFPRIAWGSVGWRMGGGEAYWESWTAWFRNLSAAERASYRKSWPEPEGWSGFYDFIETETLPPWQVEREEKIAAAAKPPDPNEVEVSEYYRILWMLRSYLKRSPEFARVDDEREWFAELYVAADGVRWRLAGLKTSGMLLRRHQ